MAMAVSRSGNHALGSGKLTHDLSSDVGRKKFGFSREEFDDSNTYYEGQFKLYQRHGQGTLHSPETGAKYVGQFQSDCFHGKGHQIWSDGSWYKGEWKNGQKHGQGEYTSADALSYNGQWEEGRRHGQGLQEYANGDRYEGWWYHGLCSGPGTYTFADGSSYEGTWAGGRYDGAGVHHSANGTRERQWYSTGVLVKREVLPPGKAAVPHSPGARTDAFTAKTILGQQRIDMHKPTTLPKLLPSEYLIRRETATMDLSAPSLLPAMAIDNLPPGSAPPELTLPGVVPED